MALGIGELTVALDHASKAQRQSARDRGFSFGTFHAIAGGGPCCKSKKTLEGLVEDGYLKKEGAFYVFRQRCEFRHRA